MIRLFGAELHLLPSADRLADALNSQFLAAYHARHGERHHARAATASLAGLLLLQASGMRGKLIYDDNGRPYLADATCDFNITHTNRYVFCAVETPDSQGEICRVGLDAEDLSRLSGERIPKLAERWFSDAERAYFASVPKVETFLRIWTRKEALVKWIGTGLVDLSHADTLAVEAERGIRFAEYRVSETLLTLCHGENACAPQEIRMLRAEEILLREEMGILS